MQRYNLFALVKPVLTTIRTPSETCCNKASFGHYSFCRIGKMLEDDDRGSLVLTPGTSVPAWSVCDAVQDLLTPLWRTYIPLRRL